MHILPPQVFDQYAGKYRHSKMNMSFTAYRQNARYLLQVQAGNDETTMELYPYSETRFLTDSGNTEVNYWFYEIWLREGTITEDSAAFDIYVLDRNGQAASGVTVDIDTEYHSMENGTVEDNYSQTTDSAGKASFTVPVDHTGWLSLDGLAWQTTRATSRQRFSHSLCIPNPGGEYYS